MRNHRELSWIATPTPIAPAWNWFLIRWFTLSSPVHWATQQQKMLLINLLFNQIRVRPSQWLNGIGLVCAAFFPQILWLPNSKLIDSVSFQFKSRSSTKCALLVSKFLTLNHWMDDFLSLSHLFTRTTRNNSFSRQHTTPIRKAWKKKKMPIKVSWVMTVILGHVWLRVFLMGIPSLIWTSRQKRRVVHKR